MELRSVRPTPRYYCIRALFGYFCGINEQWMPIPRSVEYWQKRNFEDLKVDVLDILESWWRQTNKLQKIIIELSWMHYEVLKLVIDVIVPKRTIQSA